MPFTFAHPAAILPFARWRFVPSALVIGSMSPDFEYFLRGQPVSTISHTAVGLVLFCVPVGLLVYCTFTRVCREPLIAVLPTFLRDRMPPRRGGGLALIVASLLIGATTHVVWDSFTHPGAAGVTAFPWLREGALAGVPIYKVLQHGSTMFGFAAIAAFSWRRLRRSPISPRVPLPPGWVVTFWSLLVVAAAIAGIRPFLVSGASIQTLGEGIVQAIGTCAVLVLVFCAGARVGNPRSG